MVDTDAWEALQRLMRPNETDPFFQQKAEFIAAMRREHSEFWHSAQLEYFDEGFTVESPLGTARVARGLWAKMLVRAICRA